MASSNVSQGPLEKDGGTLGLFGVKGFPQGNSWCINLLGGAFVQVDPDPVSPDIQKVIEADIAAEKGDLIDHVQLGPNAGVRLYLEGYLSDEIIRLATVNEEDGTVTFHNVTLPTGNDGKKQFEVVVIENPEAAVMTIDADGNMV